jgi:hypothetical protein
MTLGIDVLACWLWVAPQALQPSRKSTAPVKQAATDVAVRYRGERVVMRVSILVATLALCLSVMPARAAQLDQPPLPVGTTITMSNWQKYQSYMPQGIIEMWSGRHPWKLPADAAMEVGPTVEYPNPKWWYEATEKYKGQTRLVKWTPAAIQSGATSRAFRFHPRNSTDLTAHIS